MLAPPCHSLPALQAGLVASTTTAYWFAKDKWCWGGAGNASRPVRAVVARAGLSGFFSSSFGLDSQTFQTNDAAQMLWIGPVPGDIAEVEAYCRIFRAAEKLQAAIMDTLCNPETGECAVSYDVPSEDLPMLEEKVVAILGCMVALLSRERENVLSGRSSFMSTFQIADVNIVDGKIPPLAIFRGEMKRCCESLQVALANYLPPLDERNREIWRRLRGLQNVCYDAGFSRGDKFPCPTLFANWSPVYFTSRKEGQKLEDSEVAFWRGGQVTEEGLAWLLEREFKTIVDMREESAKDEYCQSVINEAVLCGKIEVVNLPVEIGTAPSMEQVEQFASLVMDATKRPIYLHSKEGVGRASAMVSRWRQFITRSSSHSTSSHLLGQNGKPTQNMMYEEYKTQQNSRSSETNFGKLSEDGVSSLSKTVDGKNHNEAYKAQEFIAACVENENKSVAYELASLHNNGANNKVDDHEMELNLKLYIESDPLKAQFPTCNIFSKKAMQAFYKSKKVFPQTHLINYRRKFELSPTSNGSAKVPIQSSSTLANSQLSVEKNLEGLKRKPAGDSVSVDLTNSTNDTSKCEISDPSVLNGNGYAANANESLTGNPYASGNSENKLQKQVLVTGTETETNKVGSYVSDNEKLALVEDNMCASATGVVRVQSRKKAEMFLVRTDGFSCTREKVTEASLAFTHPSTQQQMLMWKSPPRTVLLLKKLGNALMEEAKEVASFLHYQEKMTVLVEPDVHDILARIPGFGFVQTFYNQDTSDLHERVDFVTCLGGDGVILHASNLFRGPVPPVVSFNLGSLGFLTSHAFEDHKNDLRAVIHGNNTLGVYITLRMRLRCEIFRNGKAMPGKVFDVLNEVVVDRGSNPYLSKIECYEHNRLITKVQGDGVIVATPTGSTAYSTAAGGSMVHPNVPCMLFTPICPHSLSFRPVILPDSSRLELRIPGDTRNNAWVSFDGKRRQQLSRGDSVHISMSQHPLPTVNKADQTGDWFRSLIRCLNWNERLDQKAL